MAGQENEGRREQAERPARALATGRDPVLVCLGYVAAFEGGGLQPDTAFIAGYLRGLADRDSRRGKWLGSRQPQ